MHCKIRIRKVEMLNAMEPDKNFGLNYIIVDDNAYLYGR